MCGVDLSKMVWGSYFGGIWKRYQGKYGLNTFCIFKILSFFWSFSKLRVFYRSVLKNLRLSIAKAASGLAGYIETAVSQTKQMLYVNAWYSLHISFPCIEWEDWRIWLQFEIHTHMFVVLSGLQVNVLLWSCVTIKCSWNLVLFYWCFEELVVELGKKLKLYHN